MIVPQASGDSLRSGRPRPATRETDFARRRRCRSAAILRAGTTVSGSIRGARTVIETRVNGETLVIMVSGRGALARLAGVPSVLRHLATARQLGMASVAVFPASMRALGAEVSGLIGVATRCLSSDQFQREGNDDDLVTVVSAEWYLAPSPLRGRRERRIITKVCDRGVVSAPLARVTLGEAKRVARNLEIEPAAAGLARLIDTDVAVVDLAPRYAQRLSDNVSTRHAENKLVDTLFGPNRGLSLVRVKRRLAPMLARALAHTALGPLGIAVIKLVIGLCAAWVIGSPGYRAGVAGAVLYFASRIIGAAGAVLARVGLRDNEIREKLDLAGDTVVHVAVLWSLAGGPARGQAAIALAAIATIGVLASTAVAYVFVLQELWATRGRDDRDGPTSDEFVARFTQRDGIAYAVVFAALIGRLDLFLLAAALASHLFYLLWLIARQRRRGTLQLRRAT